MKKNKLRNIIKESIKELMNEGPISGPCYGCVNNTITPNSGFNNSNNAGVCGSVNGVTFYDDENHPQLQNCEPVANVSGPQRMIFVACKCPSGGPVTPFSPMPGVTMGAYGGTAMPFSDEGGQVSCWSGGAFGTSASGAKIGGQTPQVGMNVENPFNGESYVVHGVYPPTSNYALNNDFPSATPCGDELVADFDPMTGQSSDGFGIGQGLSFNYPSGFDVVDWTTTFVSNMMNHPNPCNFLNQRYNQFLGILQAGGIGPLQTNMTYQKLAVVYFLLGNDYTGCGYPSPDPAITLLTSPVTVIPQGPNPNLQEQRGSIKIDPAALSVLRKMKNQITKIKDRGRDSKPDPAVDRMQKLAGIPRDNMSKDVPNVPSDDVLPKLNEATQTDEDGNIFVTSDDPKRPASISKRRMGIKS